MRERDVTPEAIWLNRRALLGGLAGASVLAAVAPGRAQAETLEPNRWEEITAYNNFYEF
ncbi:MAG TPA: mononuclear molybdenum enzyme YedY, partial [Rhodobacteraceae bacterium]|nr:mononuclear molybdenum enzyme YedY [Paracoccaceae bacterium]